MGWDHDGSKTAGEGLARIIQVSPKLLDLSWTQSQSILREPSDCLCRFAALAWHFPGDIRGRCVGADSRPFLEASGEPCLGRRVPLQDFWNAPSHCLGRNVSAGGVGSLAQLS